MQGQPGHIVSSKPAQSSEFKAILGHTVSSRLTWDTKINKLEEFYQVILGYLGVEIFCLGFYYARESVLHTS